MPKYSDKAESCKARRWVFTLHDPPPELPPRPEWIRYCVWQLEKCPKTGRPHFQGYFQCKKQVTNVAVKKWLGKTSHIEVSRDLTGEDARKYCMKDFTQESGPWQEGTFVKQGGRRDIHEFRDWLYEERRSIYDINLHWPGYRDRNPTLINDAWAHHDRPEPMTEVTLRPWQQELMDKIPLLSRRAIVWVFDKAGGKGKSWMTDYLVCNHGAIRVSGRTCDIAYAYQNEPIVVVDIARARGSDAPYEALEDLRNGTIFSTKYKSRARRFKPPVVIVFANAMFDSDMWTEDRPVVFNLADK